MTVEPSFWAGRRVLVTGHTGFKGGWLAACLIELGAVVTGISLPPVASDGFYETTGLGRQMCSRFVDLLDRPALDAAVAEADPEVVFHLAAQALVLPSIEQPVDTFAVNVVGTAALLDACGRSSARVVLVVTSDKVYANDGQGRAFAESDRLGGGDPYSASKAATELVVASWRHTYGGAGTATLATARAGNVIGGGDVSFGRLLPDLLRAFAADEPVELRNPGARRPWQFVLDPVVGYLLYAQLLHSSAGASAPSALNFGPAKGEAFTVAEVADRAIAAWGRGSWVAVEPTWSAEATVLALDAEQARSTLGWAPLLGLDESIGWTVDWLRAAEDGVDLAEVCRHQIGAYRDRAGW